MARVPSASYVGSKLITVNAGQLPVFELTMSKTMEVQGQVLSEAKPASLTMRGMPDASNSSAIPLAADVRANGRFIVENVFPGGYSITLDGLADTSYLRSVKLQDQEFSPGRVEFPQGADSLRLTLTVAQDGGTISGIVVDDTRTAQAGATVVLIPGPEVRGRAELVKFAVTNAQGSFQLRGVPPGNYVLASLQPNPDVTVQDAAFIKRLESDGKVVTIAPGDSLDAGILQALQP
jgi:hypothetical protein